MISETSTTTTEYNSSNDDDFSPSDGDDESSSDDGGYAVGVTTKSNKTLPPRPILLSSSSDDDDGSSTTATTSMSILNALSSVGSGTLQGIGWIMFSLYFPFLLAPHAATKTYHKAYYQYDPSKSLFDNTIWTYGTDYGLAVIMSILATVILSNKTAMSTNKRSSAATIGQLCNRSAALLLLYGVSVTAGGLSHHFFLTVESRNTIWFRCLWSVCVGTVCAASCSMGMAGSTMIKLYQQQEHQREQPSTTTKPNEESSFVTTRMLLQTPVVSDLFWLSYGMTVTAICLFGGLSFQRPACDIFIAGITQSLPTFYCMSFFFLSDNSNEQEHEHHQEHTVQRWAKLVGLIGFILNAPLLPMYPLLVQYTDLSLAAVNTLLHSWLCVAWCMQGISMRHVIQVLSRRQNDLERQEKKID